MNATKNFEIAAQALYNESPSEKAREFAVKLSNKIRAKGEAWIAAHVADLHIYDHDVADDAVCPVEDNRLFFLTSWQVALTK